MKNLILKKWGLGACAKKWLLNCFLSIKVTFRGKRI